MWLTGISVKTIKIPVDVLMSSCTAPGVGIQSTKMSIWQRVDLGIDTVKKIREKNWMKKWFTLNMSQTFLIFVVDCS